MFKRKPSPQPEQRRRLQPAPSEQVKTAVFSYHAYRSVRPDVERNAAPPPQSLAQARRKPGMSAMQKARFVTGSLLIGIVLLSVLSLSPSAKVVVIGDASSKIFARPSATYAKAAHDLLAQSIFNRNKITIDTAHIDAELMQRFPELAAVSISLPLTGSQPVVYVQAAVPSMVLSTQSSGDFILNGEGRALATAPANGSAAHAGVPIVLDQSGLAVKVGQTALPSTTMHFILQVVQQLASAHLATSSLILPANTDELDVHLSGQSYFVKFNLQDSDARAEAGTFLAVQAYLASHHVSPTQYVDVRVTGRAYYK